MEYKLIEPKYYSATGMTAVQKVLTNRGILLKDIEHYLHTTNEDILDPCLVENIEAGAKLLVSHIARESKVQI